MLHWERNNKFNQTSSLSLIVEPPPQESETEPASNPGKPLSSNAVVSDVGDGVEESGTASSDNRWGRGGEICC